jgi:hypothetical protein
LAITQGPCKPKDSYGVNDFIISNPASVVKDDFFQKRKKIRLPPDFSP